MTVVNSLREFYGEQAQFELDARISRSLAAFRMIGRAVAGHPGRKNLIWVSGAFPLTITKTAVQYHADLSDRTVCRWLPKLPAATRWRNHSDRLWPGILCHRSYASLKSKQFKPSRFAGVGNHDLTRDSHIDLILRSANSISHHALNVSWSR